MNAAEDRLSELMDAATCALDPPLDAILAAGERQGRARKRRRHIAVVSGTAAVVLLAGVGVAAGMRDTNPGESYGVAGHQARPPQSLAPSPASPVPSPTLYPTPSGLKPGEVPINAAAAFKILRQLLPKTWTFGTYQSAPGWLLRVNVDDGKGVGQVSVRVAPVANSGMDPVDCAKQGYSASAAPSISPTSKAGGASPSSNPAPPGGFTSDTATPECFVEGIDSGAGNAMVQVITAPPSKVVVDRVIANQASGVAVEITVQNGDPLSDSGAVTRVWPPGNIDKWNGIALDHMWQLYVPAALAK